jgi:cell shape-determining protein MreC
MKISYILLFLVVIAVILGVVYFINPDWLRNAGLVLVGLGGSAVAWFRQLLSGGDSFATMQKENDEIKAQLKAQQEAHDKLAAELETLSKAYEAQKQVLNTQTAEQQTDLQNTLRQAEEVANASDQDLEHLLPSAVLGEAKDALAPVTEMN